MAIYTYFGNGNGLGASYGQGAAAFPHPLPAIVTTVAVGRQGESEGGESVGGCVFRHTERNSLHSPAVKVQSFSRFSSKTAYAPVVLPPRIQASASSRALS